MTKVAGVLVLLSSALIGCGAPHFDIELSLACSQSTVAPSQPPSTCEAMDLSCANFIDARLYAWENGTLGDILDSTCLTTAELGSPPNLCTLEQMAGAHTLFSKLPTGKTVKFRLRALYVADPSDGCNVDVFVNPKNQVVFDGFSSSVTIDTHDHVVMLPLSSCGTCGDIGTVSSAACLTPCMPLAQPCPNGTVSEIVAGDCCPSCVSSSSP